MPGGRHGPEARGRPRSRAAGPKGPPASYLGNTNGDALRLFVAPDYAVDQGVEEAGDPLFEFLLGIEMHCRHRQSLLVDEAHDLVLEHLL